MKAAIWQAIERLTRCFADRSALHDQRLAALENRVAELDAGPDSQAAVRAALSAANDVRVAGGHPPLNLVIRNGELKRLDDGGSQR